MISTQRSYKVVKANEIIQKARYELNLTELKTLAYIFSMIKPNDTIDQIYTFSINEYCKVCGIDNTSGKHYATIKQRLKALRDKSFFLMKEDLKIELSNFYKEFKQNATRMLKTNPKYEYLYEYILKVTPSIINSDDYPLTMKIYWILNDMTNFPVCPICGTTIKHK